LFTDTRHPYTLGLLKSLPRHDTRSQDEKLMQIEGSPPDMRVAPKGCPFFERCPLRIPGKCDEQMPPLVPGPGADPNHLKACWVDVRTGQPLEEGAVQHA
jgi:oligopeptide transport system ATP-binding protein